MSDPTSSQKGGPTVLYLCIKSFILYGVNIILFQSVDRSCDSLF